MDVLLIVGIGLVIFGAIILLKFPDRPGGEISLQWLKIFSKGAGMPLIVLGVFCIMASNYEVNLGNLNMTQAISAHQEIQTIPPTSTVPQTRAALTPSATPAAATLSGSVNSISSANIEQITLLKSLKNSWVTQVVWSPDGKMLAIAGYRFYLYDAQTFEQICSIDDIAEVRSIAFSPDGQTFVTASDEGIKLWKVDGCGELGPVALTRENIFSLDLSPDGTKLAAGVDMTVKLFDVATKKELKTLVGHYNYIYTVAFSPDGRMLASGSDGIKLWDVESGLELHTMAQNDVQSVAFSPDGKILASGSSDGVIKLWDVASGFRVRTLAGHTGGINSVAFSPDGKLLASASRDLTVRLWDVANGHELRNLTGHTNYVNSVAFSPDGRLLASGASDDAVRLWGIAPQK